MQLRSKKICLTLAALLIALFCFVLGFMGLSYPTKSAFAETNNTNARYVNVTSTESTSTSAFAQYGRQLLPANSTTAQYRAYVMHVPEDLQGTATISSTSATATSIKMKSNYVRDLRFRVIHYKAAENVNKVIYPLDGGWYPYSYTATYFMNADGLQEITVSAGDKIYFMVGAFATGGYRETYLNLSLNITYGDSVATWVNANSSSSTCNHVGKLAADATTTTSAFYGGTYTYGQLLTYELATVTDIAEDTTDFTEAGTAEDFTVTGTPTYGTEDGNYVTAGTETLTLYSNKGYADSSMAIGFKRATASTGSFALRFGCNSAYEGGYEWTCNGGYAALSSVAQDGTLTEILKVDGDYADGAWHELTVTTLLNRYFISIDGRLTYSDEQTNAFGERYFSITGTEYSLRALANTPFNYVDETATAQYDAMLAICEKAAMLQETEFYHTANYQKVPATVREALLNLRSATSVSQAQAIEAATKKQLDVLYYSKPSVEVLTPENSANFTSLTKESGGGLTTLNDETVYYSNGWYGFSYNQKTTNYSWQVEFMSSTTSSDLRIYFVQPSIGSASGYIFRFYQGYVMLYKPGRNGWFTASDYIFKSSKEYRDGNWHTLSVNLLDDQAFFSIDGVRFSPINNMNNSLTAASEYIYTNYQNVTNEDGTTSKVAADFNEGYVGIYGQNFYVRNFVVDYFYGEQSVADGQFSSLHTIVKEVNAVYRSTEYSNEQKEKALALGDVYRAKVLAVTTVEELSAVMDEFANELEKATFDKWVGGMQAGSTSFSGGTFATDENGNSTITGGSSWTIVNYLTKIAKNFRFDLDFNFAVSNGDVRIYFYTNEGKDEGYLLRFYAGMTILYQSPFLGTADYWNNPETYAIFKSTAINYQDGKDHTLSFNTYKNQFYLTIDEEYIQVPSGYNYADNYVNGVYTNVDENGNAVDYGDMYITVSGTNFTIKDFTTTSYSREDAVAAAQFAATKGVTDYLTFTLDKSAYGDGSWDSVLSVAASEVDKIRDCYADFETTNVDALYAEALKKLWAIDPIIHFSIHEDFEDEEYASSLSVKAGANTIAGTANNRYLTLTDTWNVVASTQRAINYMMSVDFNVADNNIIYFNFNTKEANGSRATGYMIRLFIAGESSNIQFYRGNGTESDATWIWSYANTEKYYRGSNWHNLKVLSVKGQIAVCLDNVLITPTSVAAGMAVSNGVVTEDTYKYGYFGIQSQSAVSIDNFVYTEVADIETELLAVKALNEVTGAWYLNETNALGEYWVAEHATLNVYEKQINTLTLDNGSVVFNGNNTVYTPHFAVTFKGTEYTQDSILRYYFASGNATGYRLDMTTAAVSLYLLNKDGTETLLGSAEYNALAALNTIRIFQSAGTTYVYADTTELIAVADTTYYVGGLSIAAENLTVDIYKIIVGSSIESANITTVAVAESLAVTLTVELKDNQILLGYIVKGGEYDGLYNLAAGDVLEYVDGLQYEAVVLDFEMQYGAGARISNKDNGKGLRWITVLPTTQYQQLSDLGFTFGTRITSVGSEKYLDIPAVNGIHEDETNGYTYWIGSLIGILEINYERIFVGTGYLSGSYADGTEIFKFAVNNQNNRTYKGVINAALNDVRLSANGKYSNEVVTLEGETAYSCLSATQYEELKTIYTSIEAKLEEDDNGLFEIKSNKMNGETQVHMLNVNETGDYSGTALSCLVQYNNQVILIDGGTPNAGSYTRIIDFMKAQGIEKIDYLVATHEHSDHMGGLPAIMAEFDVDVMFIRPTYLIGVSSYMQLVLDAAESKVNSDGTTVEVIEPCQEGYQVDLSADTYFRIYNCTTLFEKQEKTDKNYYSMEVHFVSGEGSVFFGGDAVGLTGAPTLLDNIGKVDVYQVQHHMVGGTAYTPKALTAVLQPMYSVATLAHSGTYVESIRADLQTYGKVYNTGAAGEAITFVIGQDGHFCLQTPTQSGEYDELSKVSITDESLLEQSGSYRAGTSGKIGGYISRYMYPVAGGTIAYRMNIPENMPTGSILRLIGADVYRTGAGEGTLTFSIIHNDTLVYEGDCSTAEQNLNIWMTITVNPGDKVYFALNASADATATTVFATLAMRIDGDYFAVDDCNHIDSANDNVAVTKNFFNGKLYNSDGTCYTRAELLSYVQLTITKQADGE